AEDGIRGFHVTGVQTCALPICRRKEQDPTGIVPDPIGRIPGVSPVVAELPQDRILEQGDVVHIEHVLARALLDDLYRDLPLLLRSEERRVGKARRSRVSSTG